MVEHGSLRAAAEVLSVTPAAISSCLTSLSRAVGVPLFSREGRGVKLTLAGISFAHDAKRLMALSRGSVVSARAAMRRIELPLRIGAVAAANDAFLGKLLAQFMTTVPEIAVELEVVRREALWGLLEERRLDLGCAEVPPHRPTLRLLAARANDYVVAAASGRRYDKRALDKSVWLVREAGSGTRSATEEFLAEHGLTPSKRTLGSAVAIVHCVVAGVGVSLLPRDMIANELRLRRIQIVRTPFTPRPRPWFLVASADRDLSVTMQRFLNVAIKSQAFAALD